MRTLRHFETLIYYDKPLVILAQDQLGVRHVCLLIDEGDTYLCAPVSVGRLGQLMLGEIELREIFVAPETNELLLGRAEQGDLEHIETRAISAAELDADSLPEPGVFLSSRPPQANVVMAEAAEKQRFIIHCSLNPPEAQQESKITAEHLSSAVWLFQRLVRHTYEKSMQETQMSKEQRDLIASARNSTLEVFAVSPGSFTIHMQTAEPADLLGYANISRALNIIDSVNLEVRDAPHAIDVLSRYSGHVVAAYKDLLQFIVDTSTGFAYEWSMPSKKGSTRAVIVPRDAKPLYEAITQRTEIGKVPLRLVGRFSKVDELSRKWRLISDDEKKYYGDSYVDLAGIVIENQKYELECEEVLEADAVSKREFKRLYLKSYRQL